MEVHGGDPRMTGKVKDEERILTACAATGRTRSADPPTRDRTCRHRVSVVSVQRLGAPIIAAVLAAGQSTTILNLCSVRCEEKASAEGVFAEEQSHS